MKNNKEEISKRLLTNHKKRIIKWSIIGLVCLLLCITLFWSPVIEQQFYLRPNTTFVNKRDLSIHFIDVGQGDAIAIRFPNEKTMLIDSGPAKSTRDLITYLDNVFFEHGKKHFDYVMLSHPDSDHSAGLSTILRRYSVGVFYRNVYLEEEDNPNGYTTSSNDDYAKAICDAKTKGVALVDREVGDQIIEGGVAVKWVGPIKTYTESNQNSMVLHLQYNRTGVLLCGDAEYNELKDIFEDDVYDVDILKIGHHGSKESLLSEDGSQSILDDIQPSYAVISVGNNTYGHPNIATIDALMHTIVNNKTTLWDRTMITYHDGSIIANIDEDITIKGIGKINAYAYISLEWIVVSIMIVSVGIAAIPKNKKAEFEKSKNQKI